MSVLVRAGGTDSRVATFVAPEAFRVDSPQQDRNLVQVHRWWQPTGQCGAELQVCQSLMRPGQPCRHLMISRQGPASVGAPRQKEAVT
jgi:hypothetical protein